MSKTLTYQVEHCYITAYYILKGQNVDNQGNVKEYSVMLVMKAQAQDADKKNIGEEVVFKEPILTSPNPISDKQIANVLLSELRKLRKKAKLELANYDEVE